MCFFFVLLVELWSELLSCRNLVFAQKSVWFRMLEKIQTFWDVLGINQLYLPLTLHNIPKAGCRSSKHWTGLMKWNCNICLVAFTTHSLEWFKNLLPNLGVIIFWFIIRKKLKLSLKKKKKDYYTKWHLKGSLKRKEKGINKNIETNWILVIFCCYFANVFNNIYAL